MGYICHTVPAATGKPCLHNNVKINTTRFLNKDLEYCEKCGCTKVASDRRLNKKVKK